MGIYISMMALYGGNDVQEDLEFHSFPHVSCACHVDWTNTVMSSPIREAGVKSAGPTGADSGIQVELVCSNVVTLLLKIRYNRYGIT